MTPNDIIAQRRAHVLARAEELGNISEACRQSGVSRTRYYEWKATAERYGIEALTPKDRRPPQMPTSTPQHVILALLTLAYLEPTLGPRQYCDRLAEQGLVLGKTAVHKHLTTHKMGRASQRVARAAALHAAASGSLAEPGIDMLARKEGPFGFCHFATDPGQLVALDSFYIGNLKGVGKIYQLTAVDTATRWAYVALILGTPDGTTTAKFLHQVQRHWAKLGRPLQAVLTDNGPEYIAKTFTAALLARKITHVRIPPRSPNHNAVVERFHGTMLDECWRVAFHRVRYDGLRPLQRHADAWLITYNTRRRNHGDYMAGRTPQEVLNSKPRRKAS